MKRPTVIGWRALASIWTRWGRHDRAAACNAKADALESGTIQQPLPLIHAGNVDAPEGAVDLHGGRITIHLGVPPPSAADVPTFTSDAPITGEPACGDPECDDLQCMGYKVDADGNLMAGPNRIDPSDLLVVPAFLRRDADDGARVEVAAAAIVGPGILTAPKVR